MNWKLYPNFSETEFRCKCGKCANNPISENLVRKLQAVRLIYGAAITVVSGYRCPAHNKKVGGAANSAHTRGTAADLRRPISGPALHSLLNAIWSVGFRGHGIGAGKLHIDVDDLGKRAWMYGA